MKRERKRWCMRIRKGDVKFEKLPGPKIVSYKVYRKILSFVDNMNVHKSFDQNTVKARKIMKITGKDE
jgi:hypothetical protein